MHHKKTIILILLNVFTIAAFGQEIIQQKRLDNIEKVLSSKDGNYLLVKSSNTFTLIEGKSRIQLGSIDIDAGKNGYTGEGKTSFINDHKFAVNTLEDILIVDILKAKIDTLSLNNKFPEMIENFHVLPGDKNQLLIATKFYPMDKNETIHFSETNNKGEPKYDDTRNCRLYLFDYAQDKILNWVDIPHSLTAIADNGTDIFAGSFDGNIFKIGSDLLFEELFNSGKEPVYYLNYIDGKFVIIPHLEKQVLHTLGKGEIRVFNKAGEMLEEIKLPSQAYPVEQEEFSAFKALPSNLIMNVLFLKIENALLINYGFNRLLKFNISSGKKEELKIPKKFAEFHHLHSDDSQILITASDTLKGIFSNPSSLAVYDLNLQKDIALFSEANPILDYQNLNKVYGNKNYYYFGKIDPYGALSVIYPSNQSRPIFLKYPTRDMEIDDNSNLLLVTYNHVTYGKLDISRIKKDTLSLHFDYDKKERDELPTEIFQPILDSRNFKETELPFGISNIQMIAENTYMVSGYNQELKNYFIVLNQEGEILFERKKLERAVLGNKNHISSSGKFLAFDYRKGNSNFLEIWNWRENNIILKNKYQESTWWSYKFDANEDYLWLRITDENLNSSIHEVDLTQPEPIDREILSRIATGDFAVDRKRNKIAITNKIGISILDLTTGKYLWSIRMSEDPEIQQTKQGFEFGTSQSYYTVNADDLSSIYFTSFEGFKPIEISSNLYYSGEKNALKNIAFVTNERGYLPSDYDLYLNRPDKILMKSGSSNHEYHKLIERAVEKRTADLPTSDFKGFLEKSPELKIVNRNDIPNYTTLDKEFLKFRLVSSTETNLESYHINVNGVPLSGKDGTKIEGNSTNFETEVQIKLSQGSNTIQFYGTDSKGFISNKEVVSIYADYNETPKVHLILVSADTYKDSDFNLNYPVKDARDLARTFEKRYGKSLVVDSLFNDKITIDNLDQIKQKITGISVNDRIILFISGHGVLDSNLEFRFATPDMDFDQVDSYGLTNTQIEEFLLSSPAREKLLLLDACHSGEFDREDYEKSLTSSDNQDVKIYEGRKGAIASAVRPSNSTFELMSQLFTDVSANTGIKVISAAAGNSFALESEKWNNGVFTFSLLSTLEEHPTISTAELKKETFGKVVKLTNGYQQPTSRGETIEFDFSL